MRARADLHAGMTAHFLAMVLFLFGCRFDLKNANINDDNCEKMKDDNLPDVVSIVPF